MWLKKELKPEKNQVYLVFGTLNKGTEHEKRTAYQMFWDGENWVDIIDREDLNENGKAVEMYFSLNVSNPDQQPSGVQLIEIERSRQINQLGYDVKHDELYNNYELAKAAIAYATPEMFREYPISRANGYKTEGLKPKLWPWDVSYWKPTPNDRKRELIKAGALIAAQIDRLNFEELKS